MECPGPASVVFDKSLVEYDFGPGHPMSPLRVDLTMRLAEELGVLEHLRMVDAPVADDDLIATVHHRSLIEAVTRCGTEGGEVSWQKVWVDAEDGSVLEAREQIAHGSGTAAYSGPNPLPIATSGSGSSYTMTDPTATTLRCQDAATSTLGK